MTSKFVRNLIEIGFVLFLTIMFFVSIQNALANQRNKYTLPSPPPFMPPLPSFPPFSPSPSPLPPSPFPPPPSPPKPPPPTPPPSPPPPYKVSFSNPFNSSQIYADVLIPSNQPFTCDNLVHMTLAIKNFPNDPSYFIGVFTSMYETPKNAFMKTIDPVSWDALEKSYPRFTYLTDFSVDLTVCNNTHVTLKLFDGNQFKQINAAKQLKFANTNQNFDTQNNTVVYVNVPTNAYDPIPLPPALPAPPLPDWISILDEPGPRIQSTGSGHLTSSIVSIPTNDSWVATSANESTIYGITAPYMNNSTQNACINFFMPLSGDVVLKGSTRGIKDDREIQIPDFSVYLYNLEL